MKGLGIALMILIVFVSFSSVSAYNLVTIVQDDGTADLNVTPPSFFWTESCSAEIELLVTATSTASFTLNNQYFMPTQNIISSSTPTFAPNLTCRALGNASGNLDLDNFYTPRTSTTSSADSTGTWARAYYDCRPDSNSFITYSETNTLDEEGHYPYNYVKRTGGYCQVGSAGSFPLIGVQLSNVVTHLLQGYFTPCGIDLFQGGVNVQSSTCTVNRWFGDTWWSMVPFNSGASGLVNITVTDQDFITTDNAFTTLACSVDDIYLWDTVNNGTTELGTSVPFFKENVLIPDRDFFLLIGSECEGFSSGIGSSTLGFNSSIYSIRVFAFEPDFVCSEFSECEDGQRFQNCTDSFGVVPDRIFFDSCVDPVEIENATFGFEEFFTDFGLVCVPDYDSWRGVLEGFGLGFTACDYLPTPQNKTRKIPVNWTTSETALTVPRDYITMTDEWSSEGFLSLKMWYIPPSVGEPTDTTTCGNSSVGFNPEIRNSNFTNIILERNITFPATNMALAFDVRACHNITEKHGGVNEPFFFNPNASVCPRECYGECNWPPWVQATNFEVQLVDPAIGLVLDYFGVAQWHETTKFVDLIPANLSPTVNYSLRVLINNDDIFTQIPKCFLMDNIRYSVLQSRLACVRSCGGDNGLTLFDPQQTEDGICVLTETPNSVACLEQDDDVIAFESCERFCLDDGTDMIPTSDCIPVFAPEFEELEDSPRCAQEAADAEEDISGAINATSPVGSAEEGIEIFLFLISPLFIYFYLMIIIGIIATASTKHWEIGGIAMIIMLFIGSLPTIELIPLWISITVMFIIGLLLANELRNATTG